MKKRDRIDIIRLILEVSNEAGYAKRMTKIMYKVLLNYPQLKEYWTVLTERGLLSYDADTQTFKTTQKGLRFLDTYNQIYDAIKILSPRPEQKQKQL
jgi:predicted transcriptional regulator